MNDLFPEEPRLGDDLSQAEMLAPAARQARARGLEDVLIVDADFHHFEDGIWPEVLQHIDDRVLRYRLKWGADGGLWLPDGPSGNGLYQDVGGRTQAQSSWFRARPDLPDGAEREIAVAREAMDLMGVDYVCLFPTWLLELGLLPNRELEAPIALAWARWATERILGVEPRIVSLMMLPFADPEASLRLVEEVAGKQGIVGFMITGARYEPTHDRRYMKVYRAIEELGLPIAFHGSYNMGDRGMHQLNRFISVHALGFPLYNMIQATNWVVNGMPERFPGLRVVFIEGGLAWVPFLMQRLDHEFLMRPSEAPLLTRRPSEYMREFFYTTQPMETEDERALRMTLEMIDADTQLLWASDWPHWDWDPPAKVWDLGFLPESTRRNILGENARRLFKLPPVIPRAGAGNPSRGGASA